MRVLISLVCVLLCIFPKAWARLGKDEDNIESLVEEDAAFWLRNLQAVPSYLADWALCGTSCETDADCGTPTSSDGCFTCTVDNICLPEGAADFDWKKCGAECSSDADCVSSTSASDGCFKCSAEKICLTEKVADFDASKCGEACMSDEDCTTQTSDGCDKCSEYAKVCI